ncbi:MutS-related protein, family 1 [hydrothermal vent metagenome]|uniref:MutS-related protein, family 1 n=1 Tax=hydrothermal vent metagenome TaxID=652676 RepID=A0A3B1DQ16_9ZZZZ
MSDDSPSYNPFTDYNERLAARQNEVRELEKQDNQFSTARGITFLAGAIGLGAWFLFHFSWLLLLIPLVLFLLLLLSHDRVVSKLVRGRKSVRYYEQAINRLQDNWSEIGATGERYIDPAHPYAGDIDLFGRGSLFQLLNNARTRPGEDRLTHWLLKPASIEDILARQTGVKELRMLVDQREAMFLLDAKVHDEIDQNQLLHWAKEKPEPVSLWQRVVAVLLGFSALTGVAWWFETGSLSLLLIVLMIEMLFFVAFRKRIKRLAQSVEEVGAGLAIFAQVLEQVEGQTFRSPVLQQIKSRLEIDGHPPSQRIAQLNRVIGHFFNAIQNQFFAPIAFAGCLTIHFVHGLERWREHVGKHIPDWLLAVGEYEALCALAQFAYEHPQYPFPTLATEEQCFDATRLGHPLLPREECIENDLRLGDSQRLIMVSGSNMSGKSTLLRTIGTNMALALAGGPVRAEKLTLSVMQLGTAMRVHDSLQDGQSLFYAVVARLSDVVKLSQKEPPLLFLLDEILQGTNSHDRRIGAEGVIRNLLENNAIGLVTTHDLALTQIVENLTVGAINIHFEDQLIDGKMQFDYHIRPGIVQRSNALELMRMMGLRFDEKESSNEN